jgi:catechol 2,3-dioxygenase
LTVKNLDASCSFYVDVIGLVVSDRDRDTIYLRGMEEACHHSLVLKKRAEPGKCERIGFRVLTEDELDKAEHFFRTAGLAAEWAEAAFQGRTLHVKDAVGTPLEICASMELKPRKLTEFNKYKGGGALRLDHFQILTPNIRTACDFYVSMGFMLSEYMVVGEGANEELTGVFLQRKGNPHDIVFFPGLGPRVHHFAFTVSEVHSIIQACDVAGVLGYGDKVERGPGRHGPGHAFFVYFRDPDGHRVELFNTHYQVIDLENEPIRWDVGNRALALPWGFPARKSWFDEATSFCGVEPRAPGRAGGPYTLEQYLGLPEGT